MHENNQKDFLIYHCDENSTEKDEIVKNEHKETKNDQTQIPKKYRIANKQQVVKG